MKSRIAAVLAIVVLVAAAVVYLQRPRDEAVPVGRLATSEEKATAATQQSPAGDLPVPPREPGQPPTVPVAPPTANPPAPLPGGHVPVSVAPPAMPAASAPPAPVVAQPGPPSATLPPGDADPEIIAKVAIDLDQVSFMLRDFRTRMGENPVGTNAEIMKAVMGDNPKQARLGPPEGQQLNARGELVDRWGTAYFFHQLSRTSMEIRSAGPDRLMGTPDDVVHP